MNDDTNQNNIPVNPEPPVVEPSHVMSQPVPMMTNNEVVVDSKPVNVLAIISMISGILAFLLGILIIGVIFGIVAIILGILSRKKAGSRKLALAGIILGIVGIVAGLAMTAYVIVGTMNGTLTSSSSTYVDPNVSRELYDSKKDFAVGEVAQLGYIQFKVNSITDNYLPPQPVRSKYTDEWSYISAHVEANPIQAGYHFLVLDVAATIKGTKPYGVASANFNIKAGGKLCNDRTDYYGGLGSKNQDIKNMLKPAFQPSMMLTLAAQKIDTIAPGTIVDGKMMFEIPNGATSLVLQYTTQGYNPKTNNSFDEFRYTLALN